MKTESHHTPKIIIFKHEEETIIDKLTSELSERGLDSEIERIRRNRVALSALSDSISMYPSVLGSQSLGTSSRSVETLIDTLVLKDMIDMLFNIPTKAILGQSYALAKINFFFMLLYLCREVGDMHSLETEILEAVKNSIFSIMAEEVFIAIISDKRISSHIRSNAGYLLTNIWEYRIDHGVEAFAPTLSSIWDARENMNPSFGTMIGISELFALASQTDPIWFDFLQRDELDDDEIDALQEFLLALSYEEMKQITYQMKKEGKSAVNGDDIARLVGEEELSLTYTRGDPRLLFKSFSHRKNNAMYRARGNLHGPKKTFEEYLMSFLLSRPEGWKCSL